MTHEPKYPVYLPLADAMSLKMHLKDTRPGVELEKFVSDLVHHWLTVETERLALKRSGPALHGYQWKNVFLPEGTSLRTSYLNNAEFATVVDDYICTEDDELLTPSLFANRHTKGRNAWRFIWLRFPGEANWLRAEDVRRRQSPATKNSL